MITNLLPLLLSATSPTHAAERPEAAPQPESQFHLALPDRFSPSLPPKSAPLTASPLKNDGAATAGVVLFVSGLVGAVYAIMLPAATSDTGRLTEAKANTDPLVTGLGVMSATGLLLMIQPEGLSVRGGVNAGR